MHFLSPNKSDFLNLVRWMAALVVVFGHVDMYLGLFGGDSPEEWAAFGYLGSHAHAAVIVFFVLSGYVVTYATERKIVKGDYGFRDYFLDRWSRIYSVLLAAIVVTLILDFIGGKISSAYHDPALIPQDGFVLRLIANVFGVQGIWGYRIQLGSNPALWSVGYEFIYYLLFGGLFFSKQLFRRRWVAPLIVTLVLGLIGWKMAAYFFVWLMGVLAYYVSRSRILANFPVSSWLVLSALLVANHLIVFLNILGLPEVLRDVVFAGVIASLLSLDVKHVLPLFRQGSRVNSYMADFSYSIYAFHTPIIFFLCSLLFNGFFKSIPPIISGVMLTAVCVLIARGLFHLTEARRLAYRQFADMAIRRVGL